MGREGLFGGLREELSVECTCGGLNSLYDLGVPGSSQCVCACSLILHWILPLGCELLEDRDFFCVVILSAVSGNGPECPFLYHIFTPPHQAPG